MNDPPELFPGSPGYRNPQPGDLVKVWLRTPGAPMSERPWVIARSLTDDGVLVGEINNHIIVKQHRVKLGDLARFRLDEDGRWTLLRG